MNHGEEIPVHFEIERELPAYSGSGESSLPAEPMDDWGQGTFNVAAGGIKGNASLLIASGQTLSYRIHAGPSHPVPYPWSRLYVFSARGYTRNQELEIRVNGQKQGAPERSTWSYSDATVSESLAFNITSQMGTGGDVEISIRNPPGGNEWAIYPPLIIVSVPGAGDVSMKSWIAEGTHVIHPQNGYSPQDLQNITVADFAGIPADYLGAELRAVSTAEKNPGPLFPVLIQNSGVITGERLYQENGIWVAGFNATPFVNVYTHHELFWEGSGRHDDMEIGMRLVILTVTFPAEPAKEGAGTLNASFPGSERAAHSVRDDEGPLPPATTIVTSPPAPPTGNQSVITPGDESLLSLLWKFFFWISGIPYPEHATENMYPADGAARGRERDDSALPGNNGSSSDREGAPSTVMYPLTVDTDPAGAFLSIDGQEQVRASPATFVLPEGDHVLEAVMDGYLSCRTVVRLAGEQDMKIVMSPEATVLQGVSDGESERSRHGGLLIETYPGELELWVDNRPMESKSPLVLYGLKEGVHTVKAVRPSASAGKGENMVARAWVYHDALSICELDFIAARLDRRIRIDDSSGNSTPFTLNGLYPLLRTPVTLQIPGTGAFLTIFGQGTYTSVQVQDSLKDGSIFSLPGYSGNYHSIMINSVPSGAEIFIDGARTGNTTPSPVSGLSEGSHLIMVSKTGYKPLQREISIPRARDLSTGETLSFVLETYPCGSLQVESSPVGAAIYLDGIATGEKTPCTFSGIPIGVHELSLKSGETVRTRDITVRPDNPNRFVVGME